MEPEVYFIRYAHPCAHILCNVRGEVSEEEFAAMGRAAVEGRKLDREFLEGAFWRAFTRISKIAEELGKDKWDVDVIHEYFCVRHNAVLDGSDYPEAFKEMCKVYEGEVLSEEEDGEVVVSYLSEQGGIKKRKVKKDYLPDLQPGDRVRIHWMYAVERV